MKVIHSDISNQDHFAGLSPEEIKFVRTFAKVCASAIKKSIHETKNCIRVQEDINGGAK